ncbi:MAG TPA: hypothetical protein VFV83_07035 [Chthoniobacteraceae bacterium]|nr:hypothetical protein [Chthoniobacteraceae bacterium]
MKKPLFGYSLAISSLLVLPTLASAQNERRGRTPEERLAAMKESLKLSDEQVAKIKPIFAKNQEKMRALREDQSLSQEDRRAKMQESFKSLEEELKPILTAEQLTKYKEDAAKRRQQRGQRQNNN